MQTQSEVSLIVLGAMLALMTSVVVEVVKIYLADRRGRKRFRLLLRLDLATITDLIDRIVQEAGKAGFMRTDLLLELAAARQGYERNRNGVVLLSDSLRGEVMECYRQLAAMTRDALFLEQTAFANKQDTAKLAWANERRPPSVAALGTLA